MRCSPLADSPRQFEASSQILDEEDEATLAAIDLRNPVRRRRPDSYLRRSTPANAPVAYKILLTEDALVAVSR
jgi:hypothetical protein